MPTYTVLKAFTDVNKAYHIVGETISDESVIVPALVQRGFVAHVPDAEEDPDWDERMDAVEAEVDTLQSDMTLVENRATTLEADMVLVENRVTTLEADMVLVENRVTTLEADMVLVENRVTTLEEA